MAASFTTMFNKLRNYPNQIAYRKCWDDDKYLFIGTLMNKRLTLCVHDGIHSDPYSVQQSDLFAHDWEVEDG